MRLPFIVFPKRTFRGLFSLLKEINDNLRENNFWRVENMSKGKATTNGSKARLTRSHNIYEFESVDETKGKETQNNNNCVETSMALG